MNLGLILELAVNAAPQRDAITFRDTSWSVSELVGLAERWRDHIRDTGQTRIATIGENHPGMIALLFGGALAGVDVTYLNPRLKPPELAHALRATESGVLYTFNVRSSAPFDVAGEVAQFMCLSDDDSPEPPVNAGMSAATNTPSLSSGSLYLFTSGTTALPKAVRLPQRALMEYLLNSYEPLSAGIDEANLLTAPLFHIGGIMNTLSSLFVLRRLVLLPRFDPVEWLTTADTECVTHAFVVPSMLRQLVESLDDHPCLRPSSLRSLAYGGAPAQPRDVLAALKCFDGVSFVGAFGLTETSSTVCILDPRDHELARQSAQADEILSSVGRPIPGVEIATLDAEGRPHRGVGGQVGEVLIRGPQVSPGYLNAPSRIDSAGWFHTGDIGFFDGEGRLHLVGRVDDMIQRGGENVSPIELELAFSHHPEISDVAAVGVSDEKWGQVVLLAIVPSGAASAGLEQRLVAWSKQNLSAHKRPACYLFLDELPRNAVGKVMRSKIRELIGDRAANASFRHDEA